MRVVVNEDMKVFHGHVPVELKKGQEVAGDLADLLFTGAARKVTRVDTDDIPEPPPVDNDPEDEDESSESSEATEAPAEFDVAGSTIDQVLEWVGDSTERALAAHAAEEARGDKARTRLLGKLSEIGLS